MAEIKHLSWQIIWRIVIVAAAIFFAYWTRSVLAILFFALIIFAAFDPVVDWFERKKLGRILGSIFVYLLLAIVAVLIILIIAPVFYKEVISVADLLPGYSEKFLNFVLGSQFAQNINELVLNYSGSLIKSGSTILSTFFSLVGGITAAVSALLISFYLLVQKKSMGEMLRKFFPQNWESTATRVWEKVKKRVGRWLLTQIFLSFLIGLSVYIVLLLMGVKSALVLALVAAVLEIVPVVGPIFAGAVSALVALSQSVSLAVWVVAVFIIIHQLESNVFVPLLMKKSVGLNPVLVLTAILIGAKLGGAVGIIFAIPLLVIFEEIVFEINRQKQSNFSARRR